MKVLAPGNPGSKRVVVLHGYTANPGRHWFPWLADEFAPAGVQVVIPELPNSSEPELADWVVAAREAIVAPDANLVVVGHSLGCITALKALAGSDGAGLGKGAGELGGLILVSGFDHPLANLPALDAFTAETPDYGPIIRGTRRRRMFVSDNDTVVDPRHSHQLAEQIGAEVTVITGGGHFRGDDGYTEFPQLAAEIRAMLAAGA